MLRRLVNLFQSKRLDAEIEEELAFHRLHSSGNLGNMTQIQEQMREASILVWLETLLRDVQYGVRQLRKAPVLVAVAILSLGLGIGANTAVFTLINAVMLQSLPIHNPEKLVLFYDQIDTGV